MAMNHAEQINQDVKDTATRRALRTLLQFVAAGGFTALLTQLSKDVPDSYAPYILILSAIVITLGQNWLEDNGVISPILGTKANVKRNTVG